VGSRSFTLIFTVSRPAWSIFLYQDVFSSYTIIT
jgi:hypothetical protein